MANALTNCTAAGRPALLGNANRRRGGWLLDTNGDSPPMDVSDASHVAVFFLPSVPGVTTYTLTCYGSLDGVTKQVNLQGDAVTEAVGQPQYLTFDLLPTLIVAVSNLTGGTLAVEVLIQ